MSWAVKKFADASSGAWLTQAWKCKIAARFTNAVSMNGDKLSALHCVFTRPQQAGKVWVGPGLMPGKRRAATRHDLNHIGSFSGALAQRPSDASPAEMLHGDLATANQSDTRVAGVAARFTL